MTVLLCTVSLSNVPESLTVLLASEEPVSVTFWKPSPVREDSERVTPFLTTVSFTDEFPVA